MSDPAPLLTSAELAAHLHLSSRTVQRYRREGVITPETVLPGGHARWDLESVKRELREMEQRRRQERP